MKQVKATATGFYNGTRIREGAVFEVPDNFKANWVADIGAAKVQEPAKRQKKAADTLSEIGKQTPDDFGAVVNDKS